MRRSHVNHTQHRSQDDHVDHRRYGIDLQCVFLRVANRTPQYYTTVATHGQRFRKNAAEESLAKQRIKPTDRKDLRVRADQEGTALTPAKAGIRTGSISSGAAHLKLDLLGGRPLAGTRSRRLRHMAKESRLFCHLGNLFFSRLRRFEALENVILDQNFGID